MIFMNKLNARLFLVRGFGTKFYLLRDDQDAIELSATHLKKYYDYLGVL